VADAESGSAPSETAATMRGDAGPEPRRDAPHLRLGRFVVLEEVGAGATGRVVRAYDPKLSREVAIKRLSLADSSRSREAVLHEAQAMAKLSHPNIVAVYDADLVDDQPFLVMEYVEGGTIRDWLDAEVRSEAEILDAFAQAAAGLRAAHDVGLVHRDFKPANVLRREDGRVLVTDFGIAQDGPSTRGKVEGTPAYMAPEQHEGLSADARSDQYAFCVALWEALTGHRPFRKPSLAEAKRTLTLHEPGDARPMPRRIRVALLRGLSPDPADRFADMDALRAVLRAGRLRGRTLATAVVGGVLAIGGGTAWTWARDRRVERLCSREASALDSHWGDGERSALAQAFASTGAHNAATLHARVLPWLDGFADAWSTARSAHCHAHATTPDPLHDAAVDCLAEQRVRFEATVESLLDPDARRAQDSIKVAAGLGRPRDCLDPTLLRARAPLPEDAERRVALESLRDDRARLIADVSAGSHRDTVTRAEALVERARELDWAPAVVDALILLADEQENAGEYEASRQTGVEAFELALAERYDVAALTTASHLVYVAGYGLGHHDEGLLWANTGRALARRLGFASDHPRMSSLLNNTAVLHWARGDFPAAKRAGEELLALKRTSFGPEHPSMGGSLENYGITLATMGDLDGAREAFESALELYRQSFGADHPNVASAQVKLGTLALQRGDESRAREHFALALPILEEAYGESHPDLALVLVNLAHGAQADGDHARALTYVERAYALVEDQEPPHPFRASIAFEIAESKRALGERRSALEFMSESERLRRESLPETHPDRIETQVALASLRFELAQRDQDRALATTAREGLPDHRDAKALRVQIDAWLSATQ